MQIVHPIDVNPFRKCTVKSFEFFWSFLILKKNKDGYFFKTQRGMISIKTVHEEVSTEYDRMERRFFQHCTSGSHYPSTFNRVSKEVFDCFGFA